MLHGFYRDFVRSACRLLVPHEETISKIAILGQVLGDGQQELSYRGS